VCFYFLRIKESRSSACSVSCCSRMIVCFVLCVTVAIHVAYHCVYFACFMSSRLSLHLVWSYIASVSNIQGGLKKTRSHCLKRPPGLGLQIYLQLRVTLTWPLTFCFRVVAQWVFGKPVRSYFSVPPCSIRQHLLSWVLQFTSLTDSADGQQVFLLT